MSEQPVINTRSDLVTAIDYIYRLQAEIDRLRADRRWIPVSQPPKVGELVWCAYISSGKYYFMQSRMNKDGQFRAEKNIKRVTHWMPLPPPPEGEA